MDIAYHLFHIHEGMFRISWSTWGLVDVGARPAQNPPFTSMINLMTQ